jgi:hypothetical protein
LGGVVGRCWHRPGSRKRLPSKDFDPGQREHEDEIKILAKMSKLPGE